MFFVAHFVAHKFYPCYKAPANCTSFENVSLTDKGILDVFPNEITAYCSSASGCAQHVLDVLKCIHLCKRDFWFANKANVSFLNQTIHDGCSNKTKSTYSLLIYPCYLLINYQTVWHVMLLISNLNGYVFRFPNCRISDTRSLPYE